MIAGVRSRTQGEEMSSKIKEADKKAEMTKFMTDIKEVTKKIALDTVFW